MSKQLLGNMFAAVAALFITLLCTGTAHAQVETYGLTIATVDVTSDNCNDLSVIPGVTGTVKYDPATKTLTLQDATIENTYNASIFSEISGLKIELLGTNSVSGHFTPIYILQPCTITGGGTLNATAEENTAIGVTSTDLTIDNCTVNLKGTYGIHGYLEGERVERLTVRAATLTIESTSAVIDDFAAVTLEDCTIYQPEGAAFDSTREGITLDGAYVTGNLVIKPTEYPLWIAGVPVTVANRDDLSVIPGVTGTVKYDPATNTLTLQDATIQPTEAEGIKSEIDGLTIQLLGTNNVTTDAYTAVSFSLPATLAGTGTLNATAQNEIGITVWGSVLTIENCTVNAKGTGGFYGYFGSNMTIRNAHVTAEGNSLGSMPDFNSVTLEGCGITQPVGATFAYQGLVKDGEVVKEKVVIEPMKTYDLWINGVQVTERNCSDLTVIPGVTGTVKYDPVTKTLTLQDATIQPTDGNLTGISSSIDGLKITVVGTNNINCTNFEAITGEKPLTISGTGTLNTTSEYSISIYVTTALSIENCTVNAKGASGIFGSGVDDAGSLTIKAAHVTAEGGIEGFKSLTLLEGCIIYQPDGAAFDSTLKGIAKEGAIVKEKVIIDPVKMYDLWILETQVNSINCNDLTVIEGVEGTVTYDPEAKTLTMQRATITSSSTSNTSGIVSNIDGLTIKVKGDNLIETGGMGIDITKSTTILGGPYDSSVVYLDNLIINNLIIKTTSSAIYVLNITELTIKDCYVNPESKKGGIMGGGGGILVIDNAVVRAKGVEGSIKDWSSITLNGCDVTVPDYAYFDSELHGIVKDGALVTEAVVIEPVYNLWISGEQVTWTNRLMLHNIDGVDGTVTYDPVTKTLTLQDATIVTTYTGIISKIDSLTIKVIGDNSIEAKHEGIYYSNVKEVIILGSGLDDILRIDTRGSADYSAIETAYYAYATDLTIKDCSLYVQSVGYGIEGSYSPGDHVYSDLTISNAYVEAQGNKGSIVNWASLSLEGLIISRPNGAHYNSSLSGLTKNGVVVTEKVVIEPGYPLWIADVFVNESNCNDLSVIPGVTGTVKYDPATKTLTLQDATIETTSIGIRSEINGATIKVIGDNSIKGEYGIESSWGGKLLGAGVDDILRIEAVDDITTSRTPKALLTSDLTIKDCSLYALSTGLGISGFSSDYTYLEFDNAYVEAQGSNGSITSFRGINFKDCGITAPDGATFDNSLHGVAKDGATVTEKVVIGSMKTYELIVNNVKVNERNLNDLSVIPGVTGTVKFDPATNTLTLQDATIDATDFRGISSDIDGLTIKVIGHNRIITTGISGIFLNKPTTILGLGTDDMLRIEAEPTDPHIIAAGIAAGIRTYEADLTIKDCYLYVRSTNYGIIGGKGWDAESLPNLVIDNAYVEVQGGSGKYDYTISDFTSVSLNECSITAPEGAAFDSELEGIAKDGALLKEDVVIKPIPKFKVNYSETVTGGTLSAKDADGNPVAGGASVVPLSTITFTATPSEHYEVKEWVVNGTSVASTELTLTVTVTTEMTVSVVFTLKSYKVNYSETVTGGTLSAKDADGNPVAGGAVVPANTVVTFTATPNEGYEVAGWTVNGADKPASMSLKETITAETTVSVTFKKKEFAVNFSAGEGGSIAAFIGSNEIKNADLIEYGSTLTFTATPDVGYLVESWIVNGVTETSSELTKTVTVTTATTVSVTFKKIPVVEEKFAVSYSAGANGTLTATVTSGAEVEKGTSVTFTATPNTGYQVDTWSVNGTAQAEKGNTFTLTITAKMDVKVTFKPIPEVIEKFAVTYSAGANGTLTATVTSGAEVEKGTSVTFTATPDTGYKLKEWTVNGVAQASKEPTLTLTIEAKTDVKVAFEKIEEEPIVVEKFAVTYSAGANGTLTATVTSGTEVEKGTSVTFTATPDTGYKLKEWTVNGIAQASKEATLTLTIEAKTDVKVAFEQEESVEALAAEAVKVYPNPASNVLHIAGLAPAAEVRLVSLSGAVVATAQADEAGRVTLDVSTLPEGDYLLLTPAATRKVVVRR